MLPHIACNGDNKGFQRDFYPDYDNQDPNDIILVYEISFNDVMEAYYRGKKLISKFREELHAFLESSEHKSGRESAWEGRI